MEKYTYLAINLCSVSIPFIASFYKKKAFYKDWKPYFIANFIVIFLFILWDSIFTHWKIWGFNPRYLTGINILNLPLEEVLFFICIPYSSVFIYFSLQYFFKKTFLDKYERYITIILLIVLSFVGVYYFFKLYTSITFLLLSCLLLFVYVNNINMSKIYFSYLIILIPFFVVNGILTGSFIDEEVVWYNNNHNLKIRLGTIPIEDAFYGFLLIASIILIYEKLKLKFHKTV